jgi:hypothetical protein
MSPVIASAARYRWAIALDIPIAAETPAADIGSCEVQKACSTICLVEEAAIVAGCGGAFLGCSASRAASTSLELRLGLARILW